MGAVGGYVIQNSSCPTFINKCFQLILTYQKQTKYRPPEPHPTATLKTLKFAVLLNLLDERNGALLVLYVLC